MNIVIYNEETINPQLGGVKRVSYMLYKAFQQDHNVYCLMSLKLEEMDEDNYYYFPDNCIYSEKNVDYLRSFICDKNIDIIINQNGISPAASLFLLKYAPRDVKIITVPHNSLPNTYGFKQHIKSEFIPHIPKFFLNILDEITNGYMFRKYKFYWNYVLKRSDCIVLLHQALLPSTLKFLKLDRFEKITWIENPCTLQNEDEDLRHKENVILFVGRVAPVKNVEFIIRSWERIYDKCENWSLVIVGDGESRESLVKYVKKHNIPRVQFEGTKNPLQYYAKSKIFCMASYYEGMPLVILEAMSFGVVPIVINTFETASAIVRSGINGFLLESFSEDDYADNLLNLIHDEARLQKMSMNCQFESKKYTIDKIKEKWYNLFEKLVN